jgi:hypothetical protein
VWTVIKEGMGWERPPKSVKEFNDEFLLERGHKDNGTLLFLVLGRCVGLCGLIGMIGFLKIG